MAISFASIARVAVGSTNPVKVGAARTVVQYLAPGAQVVGGSLAMQLPERVASLVRGGMELGHAMDAVTGTRNVKQGVGAVGILTRGLVTRQGAYETLLAYALVGLLDAVGADSQGTAAAGGGAGDASASSR